MSESLEENVNDYMLEYSSVLEEINSHDKENENDMSIKSENDVSLKYESEFDSSVKNDSEYESNFKNDSEYDISTVDPQNSSMKLSGSKIVEDKGDEQYSFSPIEQSIYDDKDRLDNYESDLNENVSISELNPSSTNIVEFQKYDDSNMNEIVFYNDTDSLEVRQTKKLSPSPLNKNFIKDEIGNIEYDLEKLSNENVMNDNSQNDSFHYVDDQDLLLQLYEKAKKIIDLIMRANDIWHENLKLSLKSSLNDLRAKQKVEVDKFCQSWEYRNLKSNESIMVNRNLKKTDGAILLDAKKLTSSQQKKLDILVSNIHVKHQNEFKKMLESLNEPLNKLDNIRDESIIKVEQIVDRAITAKNHSDKILAKLSKCPYDPLQVSRAKKANEISHNLILRGFSFIARQCSSIREIYDSMESMDGPIEKSVPNVFRKAFSSSPTNYPTFLISNESHRPRTSQSSQSQSSRNIFSQKYRKQNQNEIEQRPYSAPKPTLNSIYSHSSNSITTESIGDKEIVSSSPSISRPTTGGELSIRSSPLLSPISFNASSKPLSPLYSNTNKGLEDHEISAIYEDFTYKFDTDVNYNSKSFKTIRRKKYLPVDDNICPVCQHRFQKPGKLIPTTASLPRHVCQQSRELQQKLLADSMNSNNLTVKQRQYLEQQDYFRRLYGHEPGKQTEFCSWECVKSWVRIYHPIQLRYSTEILIDIAAKKMIA